jgi:hypothetical protein
MQGALYQVHAASSDERWQALITEGRQLARQLHGHQWRLGDLALEVEQIGGRGGLPTGAEARLRQFAGEIGVAFKTLNEYRYVASRWPVDSRRLELAWSVHHVFAPLADRDEVVQSRKRWTTHAAREHAAWRRQRPDVRPDEFEDIELADLLPKTGSCPTCGKSCEGFQRLERRSA